MTNIEKVLYTGKTHTTGGREGVARSLVDTAHQTYPYSKLSRGNIDVEINLI